MPRLTILSTLMAGTLTALAAAPPAFDVASVKLTQAPDAAVLITNGVDATSGRMRVQGMGGNVEMRNWTLAACITSAWDLGPGQMSGPAWLSTDRYDVLARTSPQTSQADLRLMLQTLLMDRFHLTAHHETKAVPVYALFAAKGGPKLHPTPGDQESPVIFAPPTSLIGRGSTMQGLALVLRRPAGRNVLDNTRITGKFDFTLTWSPDNSDPSGATGPSIFTALQEQLGLRLEPQKSQMDVLVVVHAERVPTGN